MFARAGGVADLTTISIARMVTPAPPPPYAPITFRRARARASSRRLLSGLPGLDVTLRCTVPDVPTGYALIQAVPADMLTDERQQELVDAGIPVTDVGVPNYLGIDPWANVTLTVTIPPEISGGGGVIAAQMGATLVTELSDAVRGNMLARALTRRGIGACEPTLLATPQLFLRAGMAPPPFPPHPIALAPPTPPTPLSPAQLRTPPPRSPPPAAPPAPFHAPAMLFGIARQLAIGAIAAAVAGGVLLIASVTALCVAHRRRRARLEKYMHTRYQMPTLLEAGVVLDGGAKSSKSSSSRRDRDGMRRSPGRRGGSPRGGTVMPLVAPLVPGGARSYTELARQLAAEAAAREAAAREAAHLAHCGDATEDADLEAQSSRRGHRRGRSGSRGRSSGLSSRAGSGARASDSARSWRARLEEEQRMGAPSGASSWSQSEYGGEPGPLGVRGGLAALFGLAPVEEEPRAARSGRSWSERA